MKWRDDNPTPFKFQRRVLQEAQEASKWDFILKGAAGVGKTWLSLEIARRTGRPVLVATKARVCRQFALEAHKWYEGCRVARLEGETPSVDWMAGKPHVVIVGHPVLPMWKNVLMRWVKAVGAVVVFDEVHELASHKRWEAERDVAGDTAWKRLENRAAAAEDIGSVAYRRIGLSATPQRKDRPSLWGVFRTVYGEKVIDAYGAWCDEFCVMAQGEFSSREYAGPKNNERLQAFVKARTIFVTKAELKAEIPPLEITRRRLPEKEQWHHGSLKEFKAQARKAAKEGPMAMLELNVAESAFRKRKYVVERAAADASAGLNVAIAVNRVEEAKWLAKEIRVHLKGTEGATPVYLYHGEQPDAVRDNALDRFMGKGTEGKVFVFTYQSGGTGLNIDNAHRVYIPAIPTTPEMLIQLLGRFHRASTVINVIIEIILADGTIDDRRNELLLPRLEDVQLAWGDNEAGELSEVIGAQSAGQIQAELLALFGGTR